MFHSLKNRNKITFFLDMSLLGTHFYANQTVTQLTLSPNDRDKIHADLLFIRY